MSQTNIFILMNRKFSAPRERLFQAWTQAEAMERWFRPRGQTTRVAELDLRIGGTYCFEFTGADGKISSVSGQYQTITPPEKLVFTWVSPMTEGVETLVSLELVVRTGLTEVWLMHQGLATDEMRAEHKAAWEWMLDQLASQF